VFLCGFNRCFPPPHRWVLPFSNTLPHGRGPSPPQRPPPQKGGGQKPPCAKTPKSRGPPGAPKLPPFPPKTDPNLGENKAVKSSTGIPPNPPRGPRFLPHRGFHPVLTITGMERLNKSHPLGKL